MMSGKKILVVGLPLFAKRFADRMSDFDKENKYVFLNTYYKKVDQLKFLRHIKSADLVYSINGTLTSSKVFDIAMKHRKQIIFNWAGSDVLLAKDAIEKGSYVQEYIDYPIHCAVAPWLSDELKEINIEAAYYPYLDFEKNVEPKTPNGDQLKVVSYINQADPNFYGLERIERLAEKLPNVLFSVIGMDKTSSFKNLSFYGWLDNMDEFINDHHIVLRLTDHDGLSNFVLDGLSLGRTVIYNLPLEFCEVKKDVEQVVDFINTMDVNNWKVNTEAIDFVKSTFNKQKVYSTILNTFKDAIDSK